MDNENFALTQAGQELETFNTIQRKAKALASSDIVPASYQGKVGNCITAIEMAQRIGATPLAVMQNLSIIKGRPTWSSAFLIGCINASRRFTTLNYQWCGEPGEDSYGCRVVAYEREDKEHTNPFVGEWVTIAMAKADGWYDRNNVKWTSMPGQMLRYRAAAFWQRAFAPEYSMGLLTTEEAMDIQDVTYEDVTTPRRARLADLAAQAIKEQATLTEEIEDNGTENI